MYNYTILFRAEICLSLAAFYFFTFLLFYLSPKVPDFWERGADYFLTGADFCAAGALGAKSTGGQLPGGRFRLEKVQSFV